MVRFLRSLFSIVLIALSLLIDMPTSASNSPGSPQRRAEQAGGVLAALGEQLFFDKRLSADGTVSCASCHQPAKAFSDGRPVAVGIKDQAGTRNTPSLLGVALSKDLFWDGRGQILEDEVLKPFINPIEHALASYEKLVARVSADRNYREAFTAAFPGSTKLIAKDQVAQAIAAYIRTLRATETSFDRYYFHGDKSALTPTAIQGFELFRGRAKCVECHTIGKREALFTDGKFHNRGIGLDSIRHRLPKLTVRIALDTSSHVNEMFLRDRDLAELGRFLVTKDPRDIGKFRTPSLRNVALTAPYMHNGSVATLEDAVEKEIYYHSVENDQPLIVSPKEKAYIVEFLQSLTTKTAGRADNRSVGRKTTPGFRDKWRRGVGRSLRGCT